MREEKKIRIKYMNEGREEITRKKKTQIRADKKLRGKKMTKKKKLR